MSGRNGDKSRFHRERKQKIARRNRNREMMKQLAGAHQPATLTTDSKLKAVSV